MGQLMGVSGATMPYPVTALQRDTNEWRNAVNALFEKHSRPITMQISKGAFWCWCFGVGVGALVLNCY